MRTVIFSLCIAAGLLILGSCEQDYTNPVEPELQAVKIGSAESSGQLTVMTQNVYVGTDVDRILMASPDSIPIVAAELFQMLQGTNFPERAEALAREIKKVKPHLIGLQEISEIRIEIPGDYFVNYQADADSMIYDYLDLMMQALQDHNLDYKVAGIIRNADVEVPMLAGISEEGPIFADIRLTDFDVILARKDVIVSNLLAKNYDYGIDLPELGISIPRGYVSIDAEVRGKTFRFVNTHLEDPANNPDLLELQWAQAYELTAVLSQENKPVIVVGDFNSAAPDGPTYNFMLSEGYQDAWAFNRKVAEEPGFTFGHAPDLRNPASEFYERIDYVFLRNGGQTIKGPVVAHVVGDKARDRTVNGLWPSDHGGVVVKFPTSPLYSESGLQ